MAARILVADDSLTIQKVVELTFSKEDFVLLQARSGEEAIRKAKEERPDLVLLDLVMPDKNGYDVCAALRAEPALRAVPIILLTGTFETLDKERGAQVGANDFVTKPFESQVLIGKVKQLLFAKTLDLAVTAPPVGAERVAPPKEARLAAAAPPPPHVAPSVPPIAVPTERLGPAAPPLPPAPAPIASTPAAAIPREKPAPPPEPPRVERAIGIPSAPEVIPLDLAPRTTEAISSAPPSPAPSGPREVRLEELLTPPTPQATVHAGDLRPGEVPTATTPVPEDLPSLEEPVLMAEAVFGGGVVPTPEMEIAGLPQSLSLEDLMPAELTAVPRVGEPAPALVGEPSGEVVFDLTGEMEGPSLPLVKVGTGEPPALSIEDLLGPTKSVAPASGDFGVPGLEFELSPGPPVEETLPSQEVPTGTAPLELDSLIEVPLTEAERIDLEAALAGEEVLPAPSIVPPAVPAIEAEEVKAETPPAPGHPEAPPIALEIPPFLLEEAEISEVTASAVAPPVAEAPVAPSGMPPMEEAPLAAVAMPSVGGPEALLSEMAALRQDVTERVGHELARELSDKLIDRIEKIVWEVVPDLAEILITKEIERIRAVAEGKQAS